MVSGLREAWTRLRATRSRNADDAETDSELQFHLEMATQRNVARGMTPEAARRAAQLAFGSVERAREEVWDEQRSRRLEDAWQDVHHTVRMLRSNPGFAVAAVLTLALGIGANTAIFSLLDAVMLRPLPYAAPSELVSFTPERYDSYRRWTEGSPSLSTSGAYTYSLANVTGGQEAARVWTLAVTSSLLPTLGVAPMLGRGFEAIDDVPGGPLRVLLRYGFWQTHFGSDPTIVGRTIELDGSKHEVIGVLPGSFEFPAPARGQDGSMPTVPDVWIGAARLINEMGGFRAIGRLRAGATVQSVVAELSTVATAARPVNADPVHVKVQLVEESVVAPMRPALLAFTAAVALLLLIACANLGSLLLARLAGRNREFALRVALGASRARIVRQILTESSVLALMGALLSLGIAWTVLHGILVLAPSELARVQEASLNARTLAVTLALAVATALLIGVFPALRVRRDPHQELGSSRGLATDRGTSRMHSVLVACEVAFAVVLLIGGGLLLRTFESLASVNPGFRAEGLVTVDIRLPSDRYGTRSSVLQFFDQLEQRLAAQPGVRSVSAIDRLPYGTSSSGLSFRIVGRPATAGPESPRGLNTSARPAYFATMGIPLVRGREFTPSDRTDSPPVVVIGRALADRYWPNSSPLGERISVFGVEREIIGVAGDVRHFGPLTPMDPLVYLPQTQDVTTRRMMTVVVRTDGSLDVLLARFRTELRALDPHVPVSNLRSFGALQSQRTASQRFNALIVGSFGALAVLLAAVGIYGVMSFVTTQRTREIGVRMALGATRTTVLGTFLRHAMSSVAAGALAGVAIALPLTRLARSMLFGVGPTDLATYSGVLLLVGVIALLAAWLPVHRIAGVSPSTALARE